MSDRARRAGGYGRAAAEPLLDELISQSAELAKRWAIALIEGAGPDELGAIDLGLIASEGPELIDGVLGGEAHAGALARIVGADGGELARAAEALRRVLCEAAVEAVPRARSDARVARRLLDLGEGIAASCAELLACELDGLGARQPLAGEVAAPVVAPAGARARGEQIAIVDERHGGAGPVPSPAVPDAPSIAARDTRQGPAAWIGSIGAQLEAFEQDRRPFSVLLIEMLEPPAALDAQDARRALEERLGQWRGSTLTREGPGRWWLLAPGVDRAGAESLRDLVESPRGAAGGGPVAVGIALCPDDGRDAAGLAAHADLDLYMSRSRAPGPRAGGPWM